jgi:hypothetical protein
MWVLCSFLSHLHGTLASLGTSIGRPELMFLPFMTAHYPALDREHCTPELVASRSEKLFNCSASFFSLVWTRTLTLFDEKSAVFLSDTTPRGQDLSQYCTSLPEPNWLSSRPRRRWRLCR